MIQNTATPSGSFNANVLLSALGDIGVTVITLGDPFQLIPNTTGPVDAAQATYIFAVQYSAIGGGGADASVTPYLLSSMDGVNWFVCAQAPAAQPGQTFFEQIVCMGIGSYIAVAWMLDGAPAPRAFGNAWLKSDEAFKVITADVTVDTTYATPASSSTEATEAWVTLQLQELAWKAPVRAATTVALPAYTRVGNTITANANGAMPAIDGITLVAGERMLLKDGAAGADNGIYVVTHAGTGGAPWQIDRADDLDTSAKIVPEIATAVQEGTVNARFIFRLATTGQIVLNTTALVFSAALRGPLPAVDSDYATKAYVDAANTAGTFKTPVRAATAAALPAYTRVGNVITANANGALPAVDGVTLVAGDRMLLKDGAVGLDNGIYRVTQVGSGGTPFILTRAADFNEDAEVVSECAVLVSEGTSAGVMFRLITANPIVVNTTALTFNGSPQAPAPLSDPDATPRSYIDARTPKNAVRAATAVALPAYTRVGNVITANANGALAAIDGVTLVAGDRMLLKDGAAGADNGIYVVTAVGTGGTPFVLTRATDMDSTAKLLSESSMLVSEGTTNVGLTFRLTTANPLTLNATALTFSGIVECSNPAAGLDALNFQTWQTGAFKAPVRAATMAALAAYTRVGNVITANANGALAAVDGVNLVAGNRMLLRNGAASQDNGIYDVTQVGSGGTPFILTRSTDYDASVDVHGGDLVPVAEGTIGQSSVYEQLTTGVINLNTTVLVFNKTAAALESGRDTAIPITLNIDDNIVTVDSTAGDVAVTLPVIAAAFRQKVFKIANRAAANNAVVTAGAGNTVNGGATKNLAAHAFGQFWCPQAGTDWIQIG